MTQFIIVGRGLAATCLMHQFYKQDISFIVIGNNQLSLSSRVAAGIWNPVVFKRLTSSWMAKDLIFKLEAFYSNCEKILDKKFVNYRELIKPFTEEQEKVLWQKKSQNELIDFLDNEIYSANEQHQNFKIINQYGKVKKAGSLDVPSFIDATDTYFKNKIINETFDYDQLSIQQNEIKYKEIVSKNIIFCEGYLVKNNPYFNWIPLVPAKGETITIKTDGIKLKNFIFNRDGFIVDIENSTYKVGATYEWQKLNDDISEEGLKTLKQKLDKMIESPYQIISHEAGVRPSSKDRRPIIGPHPKFKNLFVFNGLGSKGVMLAPYFSENFVLFYLEKEKLNTEVNIQRFYKLYESITEK
jgi:hypothetical protein